MSVSLLAPLGLAALAALALPILIHLVRRIELQTTPFAALRWISDRVQPRRRIRIERPWLLLLRLLLLALLAVLLARPVTTDTAEPGQPWGVIVPGVDRAAIHAAAVASGTQWHWLAPGFPSLDETPGSNAIPVASLLRQLDADLPAAAALTVLVPEELAGLDAERMQLSHSIDWRVVPGRMATRDTSTRDGPIRFAVRYASEDEPALGFLRAAVIAWNTREPGRYQLDARPIAAPIADDTRWLAWLAPDLSTQATAWIEHGGVALVAHHPLPDADAVWRDASGRALARQQTLGAGRLIGLPAALVPTELPMLLDADFPDRLRNALQGPRPAPTRAHAESVRPLHDASLAASPARSLETLRPLDPWLALLIALLFLLERIVATHRAREAR